MYQKIVAVGDCNTLGAKELEYNSYPEILEKILGTKVTNLGHTMATTREGLFLLGEEIGDTDCVIIQFGLVDSYLTFKLSPYVLYYPDNAIRKQFRSVIKKYKKICRKIGFNKWIGESNVVPIEEYDNNIRKIIKLAHPRPVILLDTIPNKQMHRNREIQRYNKRLEQICKDYDKCIKVDLYDVFLANLNSYYLDATHANANGYRYIAGKISSVLKNANL